jgi:DNA-binding GntR family transcriptional regulator
MIERRPMSRKSATTDKAYAKAGDSEPVTLRKKELMSDTVYRSLRDMIALDRFKPGQRLNVNELARELGVSRTPVWETMRRLGQEGFLRSIPNRGVFVAERPLERVRDILEVRTSLDRLAGRLAVERVNRRILSRLSQCLPEQLRAIEAADIGGYVSTDSRFHRLICEATGNVYLTALYESITIHVLPTPFNMSPLLPSLYLVHQEIFSGLSDRNPGRVDAAIARHEEIVMAQLREQMRSEEERKEMVRAIRKGPPAFHA